MPTPPPGQLFSTFQIGTWNPATDTWTLLIDLNQPTTGPVFIMAKYPQWAPGEKTDSRSETIRTVGERIVETNLKNGHWKVKISIRGASTAAIAATVRSITQALEQQQLCIRYSAPEATQYLYFDVRKVTHNLHQATAQQLIAGVQSGLIDFECYPLARGDRIWLQNLVCNAGTDAPSGPAVLAFQDNYATTNAYTLIAGSAPSVASGVMTVPIGTTVTFGSPAWGSLNTWSARFQYATSGTFYFYLHFVNGNNYLNAIVTSTTMTTNQFINSVNSQLATGTYTALTNGTFYWIVATQFPAAGNQTPYVVVTLFNDSGGAIGTSILRLAAFTVNGTVALVGTPGFFASGAALKLGGFGFANSVTLFGPGAWTFSSGGTGPASGAWDGTRPELGMSGTATAGVQTTPNGPVNSTGAIRVDAAPAGGVNTAWITWAGGSAPTTLPSAAEAIPTVQGHVLGVAAQLKTNASIGSGCAIDLNVVEYNSSGTNVASGIVVGKTGAQTTWTALSGTYTVTNAATAYVAVQLVVVDATSGSVNGTVWWDNIQCWDQTTTGETSMPYCEMRFAQSPCQLLLSGLLGDQPAPLLLEFGTYVTAWNTGQTLSFGIGRKATTGMNALMVSTPASANTSSVPSLVATAYGGLTLAQNGVTNSYIFPSLGIMVTMPDAIGIYHLLCLMQTAEPGADLLSVLVQYTTGQVGPVHLSGTLGPLLTPFTASAALQPLDLGQIAIPTYSLMAATGQTSFIWYVQIGIDDTFGTAAETAGWHFLLPYDAETLLGQILNPSGYQNLTNTFLWFYNEALTLSQKTLFPQSWQAQAIGGTVPNSALAAPTFAGGGPGTSTGPFIAINPTGSSFLREDPTQTTPNSSGLGVNQFGAFITDNTGTVLPFLCDVLYSPYYYYQR